MIFLSYCQYACKFILPEVYRKYVYLVSICLFLAMSQSYAQTQIEIQRIQGEIKIDGSIDEPAWELIEPLKMVMHIPVSGNEPGEKNEVRIGYNNDYLFVGARLFDSEPSRIMVTSKKRDEFNSANDWFGIILDSFNDKENGLGFFTNPLGLRTDFAIFKDALGAGGPHMPYNESWNTFWDVRTLRNDQGWFVEMRIPISSIRFKENNGSVVMGLICWRWIPRLNEKDVFPSIPNEWGEFSSWRPSKAREVVFNGLKSTTPFYIAPYTLVGIQQDHIMNETRTGYSNENTPKYTAGLDIKYGLTNNLTMDLTVNPDFAQVEADDEQINLTRFPLFFPEKRLFFQERSSIFDYEIGGFGNSLFYSRRIGLYEGEQVPIYGGARVTGMAGKWDMGFLDMQTQALIPSDSALDDLPSENFSVLRMRRQVINENTYVGGIYAHRLGLNGAYNTAYGLDGIFRLFRNDYVTLKWAQIFDDESDNNPFSLKPSSVFINYEHWSEKGLSAGFLYSRSGEDFNPEMGFQERLNTTQYAGRIGYGWIPGENSPVLNHGIQVDRMSWVDNGLAQVQSTEWGMEYQLNTKSSFGFELGANHQYENVVTDFQISRSDTSVGIPAGEYNFSRINMHGSTPESNKLNLFTMLEYGGFFDGTRFSIMLDAKWNIGTILQLGMGYEYIRLSFPDRNCDFTGHIPRFKALLMMSTKLTLWAFLQYNSDENNVTTNLRFRYNPREGNDLYLVFNEGRNTNIDREYPALPAVSTMALLFKYTYTFRL